MSLIRPEAAARLYRWREAIGATLALALGLWLATRGGWLLLGLGAAVMLIGAGLLVTAVQRLRFAPISRGPGVVEVDEGQIGYLGPGIGGFVALPDLVEIKLITLRGRRLWRLKQADGQTVLIPVEATGAERLFDAFASLPGLDGAALIAALEPTGTGGSAALVPEGMAGMRLVWRRPGAGLMRG